MQNFGQELSVIMGKPVGKFHWRLQTDQPMSILGPNNSEKPCMMVEIVAYGNFDQEESCRTYVPKIFEFLTTNTDLTTDQIFTQFIKTEPHLLGVRGNALS